MTTYLIEPRDTLVLGDGRGIGQSTATRSLELPWPSSVAGLLRTEGGRHPETRVFDTSKAAAARGWKVRGPLAVDLDDRGEPAGWLAPAPRDAVFFGSDADAVVRRQLVPRGSPAGATNLPTGLQLIGMDGAPEVRKPWTRAPRYWRWREFEQWLVAPQDRIQAVTDFGRNAPERERRHHVSISSTTRTVKEHVLFEIEHVNYRSGLNRGIALAATFEGPELDSRVVGLGGERRLSFMRPTSVPLPKPPNALAESIKRSRQARLVLLTPAIFDEGFRPSAIPGASLIAAAVDRPLVVSGWDWAVNGGRGAPKAARRCAPAGSVYWVRLDDGVDAAAWVNERWLESLSSDAQDRCDGFGLAAVGVVA